MKRSIILPALVTALAHANSPHAVSQYDVAGFQWEQHH